MNNSILTDKDYSVFIKDIKHRIKNAQIKAAVSVNQELLNLYWDMAAQIVEKQKQTSWGDGFLERLSKDLQSEFPDIKGFSKRNLELMRQWYKFWSEESSITQQLVSQIPWGHNLVIISKTQNHEEALFYVQKTKPVKKSRKLMIYLKILGRQIVNPMKTRNLFVFLLMLKQK